MVDTYLIEKELLITRQEGDTASIVFSMLFETGIDLTDYTVKFQVFKRDVVVIDKTTADNTIQVEDIMSADSVPVVEGQSIIIPLAASDTEGKSGVYSFEMEISKNVGVVGESIITIGEGGFTVVKQKIRNV